MNVKIMPANPGASYLAHRAEIDAAIADVLEGGWYIMGRQVRAFEEEFAAYCGVRRAVGVGSGTAAIYLALRAGEIGPGDEVIAPTHTAVATIAAIEMTGARPVLVDADPATFNLAPAAVAAAITARTRAIVPVHLYGYPADLAPLLALAHEHGLRLIEDCAQAHGARYRGRPVGSWGELGCFSFYPTMILGAMGDGGAVVTNDEELAARVRLLQQYGWAERYISYIVGVNSRLDELQAAILRVKLKHLEASNAARLKLARLYDELLAGCDLTLPPGPRADIEPVYHLYVVRSSRRDALRAHLGARGIGAGVHYPQPVHLQPAYLGRLGRPGDFPQAERMAQEVLSLPLYPELTTDEVRETATAIRQFG